MLQVQQPGSVTQLPILDSSLHLVFSGNPGTGKTTVGAAAGPHLPALGVLSKGHLVEADRSQLVAGYIGQTAIKTGPWSSRGSAACCSIDEAYTLARGGETDFGREAIDTLVKLMEDHRDDLAVVAAGYTDEMATFIAANPGLRSRFTRTIEFADYTDDERVEIFCEMGETNRYVPTDGAVERLRTMLAAMPRATGLRQRPFRPQRVRGRRSTQASRLVTSTSRPTSSSRRSSPPTCRRGNRPRRSYAARRCGRSGSAPSCSPRS